MANLAKINHSKLFSNLFNGDFSDGWGQFESNWILEGKKYVLRLEVPGFSQSDLKVTVLENSMIQVLGSASTDNKFRHSSLNVSYTYSLPSDCDSDTLDVEYQSGVLLISVDRKESSARELTIKTCEESNK